MEILWTTIRISGEIERIHCCSALIEKLKESPPPPPPITWSVDPHSQLCPLSALALADKDAAAYWAILQPNRTFHSSVWASFASVHSFKQRLRNRTLGL